MLRRAAQLLISLLLAACSDQAVERPRPALGDFLRFEAPPVPPLETIVGGPPEPGEDLEDTSGADEPIDVVPYACERFELRVRSDGRVWHKRLRRSWSDADRQRFRKLVVMVADELGADPKLLTLWALRESTYNPYAIHVLDPDVEGSTASWRRHRWDPERAAELEARMAELGARDPGYWTAKAELARISRFRDNPHYDAKIDYELVATDGSKTPGRRSAWSYGYGPFGFNPTYFMPLWDASAPPWVFCNDDGLAAIVTAIWAAREHQRECAGLGFGASNEVVNRRFSSGHCSPRPGRAQKFRNRALARGIDPEARAKLGDRWPADRSDRAELLAHLRSQAAEQGLLSPHAELPRL
ncbi:MAG: hypothetical protein R6X02_09005 [Enhygromyxa sp.]